MKKIILTLIAALLTSTTTLYFAQEVGNATSGAGGENNCSSSSVESLRNCIDSKGMSFELFEAGSYLFLNVRGVYSSAGLNNCVGKYNSAKSSCTAAPTLVVSTQNKSTSRK